jgi:hypothetical protein
VSDYKMTFSASSIAASLIEFLTPVCITYSAYALGVFLLRNAKVQKAPVTETVAETVAEKPVVKRRAQKRPPNPLEIRNDDVQRDVCLALGKYMHEWKVSKAMIEYMPGVLKSLTDVVREFLGVDGLARFKKVHPWDAQFDPIEDEETKRTRFGEDGKYGPNEFGVRLNDVMQILSLDYNSAIYG